MRLKEVQVLLQEISEKYKEQGVADFEVYERSEHNWSVDEIDVETDDYLISFSEKYIAVYFG